MKDDQSSETTKRVLTQASPGVRALNPKVFGLWIAALAETVSAPAAPKAGGLSKPRGRKAMNKTEAAFSQILEAKVRRGDYVRYDREGITLRWACGMTYTPDFSVLMDRPVKGTHDGVEWISSKILLVEVKGAWIEEDARVKFLAARERFPEYAFEMWQLDKHTWTKIL
jgi:hypothetical protein